MIVATQIWLGVGAVEFFFFWALLGLFPTVFSGSVLGLISSRRGYKYFSGFGYGALIGALAYLPWVLADGMLGVGMIAGVLGVTALVLVSRKKFPKVPKQYEKRT